MIQVSSLTKDYAGRRAITDVTFSAERGEILGFLGPNGAGKTTTMRILTGFLPPTSGTATVAGFDVSTESLEARRHIGYLPESVPLYKDLRVYDYLDFIAQLRGIPKLERPKKIERAMEKLALNDRSADFIGKLSKGYRQRVGIAQAVLHEPDVMILDEPTEGLDPRQRTEARALIRELGKEHTVILSTHILPEVEATCDRVLIISEGRIVAADTPAGLQDTLKRGQLLTVLVKAEEDHVKLALQGIEGITRVSSESLPEHRRRVSIEGLPDIELRHLVARSLVAADIDLYELNAKTISLEDIFLRLTTTDTAHPDESQTAREALPSDWAADRAAGGVHPGETE
ncbi:MAG: ABC transporter ATP-binding protein [Candidatus Dormibacteria bacterium]